MDETDGYYTDTQIAAMLGKNPATVRRWRVQNKRLGVIKYGPPYEFHGHNVVYPKQKFREWCAQVRVVGGVPKMNLPLSADRELLADPEQQSTVKVA